MILAAMNPIPNPPYPEIATDMKKYRLMDVGI